MNQVEQYFATLPDERRPVFAELRNRILAIHPDITETIKYGMPTYVYKKNIFHFAANKHHIGLYPSPLPIAVFASELTGYRTSKGAIQIPYDQPIPFELVERMIRFQIDRMNEL